MTSDVNHASSYQSKNTDIHYGNYNSRKTSDFDELIFKADKFDSHDFVTQWLANNASSTSTSSLEKLDNDLRKYGDKLNHKLIDLLNRKYSEFINLSANLAGTDEFIVSIRKHVLQIKTGIDSTYDDIKHELDDLEEKLDKKRSISARVQSLQMVHEIYEVVKTIQSLLAKARGNDFLSGKKEDTFAPMKQKRISIDPLEYYHSLLDIDDTDDKEHILIQNCVLMERTSRQIAQLRILLDKGKEFTLVQAVVPQVHHLEKRFVQMLELNFLHSIEYSSAAEALSRENYIDSINRCLRSFVFQNNIDHAEEIVRKNVVRPFIQKHLTKKNIRSISMSTFSMQRSQANSETCLVTSKPKLHPIYEKIINYIRVQLGPLLEATNQNVLSNVSSPFTFNFLANSVWHEIEQILSSYGSLLFSVGIPDSFHHNYTQSMRFISHLKSLISDPLQLQYFDRHPSSISFKKKWNLSVYFQLRFQQAASALESVVNIPLHLPDSSSYAQSSNLTHNCSQVLWDCLNFCWSDGVWIDTLSSNFFKLTFQLINRYAHFIETELNYTKSEESSRQNTNTCPLMGWIFLDVDLHKIIDLILSDLEKLIMTCITSHNIFTTPTESSSPSLHSALKAGLGDASIRLQNSIPVLRDHISTQIAYECCKTLQAVPRINATYQMTSKKVPTEHSRYVPSILTYMEQTLFATTENSKKTQKERALKLLPENEKHAIALEVCTKVAKRFQIVSEELIMLVDKTEATLEKLSRGKKKLNSNSTRGSEKVRTQLFLDLKEFRNISHTFIKNNDNEAIHNLDNLISKLRQQTQTK